MKHLVDYLSLVRCVYLSGPNSIELLSRDFCLANSFAEHYKTDYQLKYVNFMCKFGW